MLTIRKGMDVFNADQSRYIGTVVRIRRSDHAPSRGEGATQTGSSGQAVQGNPPLVHEQGHAQSPTEHMGKQTLGEELGPVPTIALGNTGPTRQSAGNHYATAPSNQEREIVAFGVRRGRINLGVLSPFTWVPVEAIRSISQERIVLAVMDADLAELESSSGQRTR